MALEAICWIHSHRSHDLILGINWLDISWKSFHLFNFKSEEVFNWKFIDFVNRFVYFDSPVIANPSDSGRRIYRLGNLWWAFVTTTTLAECPLAVRVSQTWVRAFFQWVFAFLAFLKAQLFIELQNLKVSSNFYLWPFYYSTRILRLVSLLAFRPLNSFLWNN